VTGFADGEDHDQPGTAAGSEQGPEYIAEAMGNGYKCEKEIGRGSTALKCQPEQEEVENRRPASRPQ
jgi:hypothetical protein